MIDLNKTKIVLLDFDDTLCIHTNHVNSADKMRKHNADVIKLGADYWNRCQSNKHLKLFMHECQRRDIRLGLISTTPSFVHSQAKHDWVLREYGIDLENFCTGTFEGKVDIMTAISDAYNIPKETILFVDDYWENTLRAANAGFQVCTPMEVVNYIENN